MKGIKHQDSLVIDGNVRELEDENLQDIIGDSGAEDEEDDSEAQVSPNKCPPTQATILNVKSRLHQYNFVTNKNEAKFS